MNEDVKKEFQLGKVKVELSKAELEKMLQEIDKEEFDYPICCKRKGNSLIVLFDALGNGKVLHTDNCKDWNVGNYHKNWIDTTNKDRWEQIPYDKERGLYHGQWVWCWDNPWTQVAQFRKYDAINKCSYTFSGREDGFKYDNYSATCPEYMKEAFQDLINNEKALGTIGIEF